MTIVVTDISSGPYIAIANDTFAVTFQSAGDDQVFVRLDDELVDPNDYSFERDDDGTGQVVFAVPVTGVVEIFSQPYFTQTTEFQRFGSFFPDMINKPLDKAAARDLYLKDRVDQVYPDGTTLTQRANRILGFDGTGAPTIVSGIRADDDIIDDGIWIETDTVENDALWTSPFSGILDDGAFS